MKQLAIILPRYSRTLSPNGRSDRWAKAAAVSEAKMQGYVLTLAALNRGKWEHATARLQATFYVKHVRFIPDDDNALGSLKAYRDGIAKALEIDDRNFTWEKPLFVVDKCPRIEITIRSIA